MVRLIDANALYKKIFHEERLLEKCYVDHLGIITEQPTVDAVEVVRCHECVHHVDCGYYFCNMWCANCPDDSDFFCAYGERDGGVKDAAD